MIKNSLLSKIIILILSLLVVTISMSARAAPTGAASPPFDIFVGPGDQTYSGGDSINGLVSAFDAANNRFLVVWTDQQDPNVAEISLYARLVNPNGSAASAAFVIANGSGLVHIDPNVAYDPNHNRFLVVWSDSRHPSRQSAYGQLVNATGTLYGENFAISPNTALLLPA